MIFISGWPTWWSVDGGGGTLGENEIARCNRFVACQLIPNCTLASIMTGCPGLLLCQTCVWHPLSLKVSLAFTQNAKLPKMKGSCDVALVKLRMYEPNWFCAGNVCACILPLPFVLYVLRLSFQRRLSTFLCHFPSRRTS